MTQAKIVVHVEILRIITGEHDDPGGVVHVLLGGRRVIDLGIG